MNNSTKTYWIYSFNGWFIVLFFLLGMILPLVILASFFDNKNPFLFVLTMTGFTIASYFLTRKIGLQPIQVNFESEKIIFQFLTKDLNKVKKKKIIPIKSINGFSDFTFGYHSLFKLKLKHNINYRLEKNGFWNKDDDFEKLVSDFKIFINKYNKEDKTSDVTSSQREKIEYKDFFQTPKANLLFYVTIVIGIWTFYMLASGKSHSTGGALVVLAGMLGYIGTYLTKRIIKK